MTDNTQITNMKSNNALAFKK